MYSTQIRGGLDCNVLVLNKHYMALRVVNIRRALSMLYQDHAEVINCQEGIYYNHDFQSWCEMSEIKKSYVASEPTNGDWISTVNFYIAVPRIIRLLFYDRLPKHRIKFNRRNIFGRDKNKCQYCGKKHPTSELSLDHVTPKSQGGENSWENIVCACTRCNCRKGGRTPKQAGMSLIVKPVKPKRNPLIHVHLNQSRYSSWKQFLDNAYWSVELK